MSMRKSGRLLDSELRASKENEVKIITDEKIKAPTLRSKISQRALFRNSKKKQDSIGRNALRAQGRAKTPKEHNLEQGSATLGSFILMLWLKSINGTKTQMEGAP